MNERDELPPVRDRYPRVPLPPVRGVNPLFKPLQAEPRGARGRPPTDLHQTLVATRPAQALSRPSAGTEA
jgi:hypothetical protein